MAKRMTIKEEDAGRRADVVATEKLPMLSRAYVHKLFGGGRITINKLSVKPGHKLRQKDIMRIDFDPSELGQIPDIDLPILYENNDVMVINKPAGVISHARGRYWNEASVASFVRQKTGQEGERAGIVHRLDRATSGVIICAKNAEALSWLQKQFSQRKVKKTYVAYVHGHIKDPSAIIDMPIERHPKRPQTFRVGQNGKPALTRYEVVKSLADIDKVVLSPETGRTHQLRVHLKQIGHPIVGDMLYDQPEAERLYLHALSLEITLPDRSRAVFTAPEPKEFKEFEKNNG